jgi:carboxymethylenebutenolidase
MKVEVEMTEPLHNRYLAIPPSGKGAGVLVLHAWWGLNDVIRDFCDQLAQEGFVALAPDMFSGAISLTIAEAEAFVTQLDEEQAVPPEILSAVADLRSYPAVAGDGLGVVGFSFGGYWALWLAQKEPEWVRAVALFYGTNGGDGDFQQSKAAYLGHFAETDPYESAALVQELEKNLRGADRPVTFHTYPGTGHWFFEQDRPDAYHAQSAQLAWDRTIAFLHDQLEGAPG